MYEWVFQHKVMLADQVRIVAYHKAVQEVVKKGDIVVDLGTGSGILAFFAIQAGAKKVYAIEQGDIIEDTKRLAIINGLDEKIVFIKEQSCNVELPEKVDVIISELIGHFGLEENLPRFKIDARERFLKPGGRLVPSWLELYLVPVEAEAVWNDCIGFWSHDFYGLDFSPVRNCARSERYVKDCSKATQLAPPSMIAHINLNKIEKVPLVFHGEFIINKKGTLHGLVGFFLTGLSHDVILSTAPEQPLTHWSQTFFPLDDVLMVEVGDEVHYQIKAIPQRNHMYWQWETSLLRNGTKIAGFNQSNLQIAKEELVIGRESFQPVLAQQGMVRRRILDLCDGTRSVEEISELIQAEYPDKYSSIKDAMQDVVDTVRGVVRI